MALPRSIVEFAGGEKGLVPAAPTDNKTSCYLRGDGNWQQITASGQEVSVMRHWENSTFLVNNNTSVKTTFLLYGTEELDSTNRYDYHIILGSAIVNPSDVYSISAASDTEVTNSYGSKDTSKQYIKVVLNHTIATAANMVVYYWPLTVASSVLDHNEANTSQTSPASIYAVSKVNTKAVAALPKAGGTANAMTGPLVVKNRMQGAYDTTVSIMGNDSSKQVALEASPCVSNDRNTVGGCIYLNGKDCVTSQSADGTVSSTDIPGSVEVVARAHVSTTAKGVAADYYEATCYTFKQDGLLIYRTSANGDSDNVCWINISRNNETVYNDNGTVDFTHKNIDLKSGNWDQGARLTLYHQDSGHMPSGFELVAVKTTSSSDTHNVTYDSSNHYAFAHWFQGSIGGSLTWTGTTTNFSSDKRLKQQIAAVPNSILDAWDNVEWCQYKYNADVQQKGDDNTRLHLGLVAQDVQEATSVDDVDLLKYGILCKEPKKPGMEDDLWTVRYIEALAMEAAYQRRKNQQLQAQIDELKAQVQALIQQSNNSNANNGE